MARKPKSKVNSPAPIPASAWKNFGLKHIGPPQPIVKTTVRGRDPRPYLAGAAPGLWSSNHLEEANQVKGYQFVAIRALARMCSQADMQVHRIEDDPAEVAASRLAKIERSLKRASHIGDPVLKAYRQEQLEAKREKWRGILTKATATDAVKQERTPARPGHPLVKLLQRPNPEWSGVTFMFAAVQQIAATGLGLIWAIRNDLGVPVELYVIPTGLAMPRLPRPEFPYGSYWITPLSVWGQQPQDLWAMGAIGHALLTGAEVDARDVKKICWPHPLYLTDGMSPLSAGSTWVDLGNEMDRAAWYRFQNAERPGIIFEQDPDIDPDNADKTQFREDLRSDSSGTPNTGKHLVLPPGVKPSPWNQIERELEFVGSRPQIRDMNLALHGMTPISCGFAEAQAYAAYWAALKQTTDLAVQPVLGLVGGELTEFLGPSWPDGRYEVTYKARAIDDPELLEKRLATDIQAGNVLLVKEYRALRGQPPLGDERDEEFVGAGGSEPAAASGVEQLLQPEAGAGKDDGKDEPQNGKPSKDGPGLRSPFRDAPPGRNGVQKTHGRRLLKVTTDASGHDHDDSTGQFTGDGGGSGGNGNDADDSSEASADTSVAVAPAQELHQQFTELAESIGREFSDPEDIKVRATESHAESTEGIGKGTDDFTDQFLDEVHDEFGEEQLERKASDEALTHFHSAVWSARDELTTAADEALAKLIAAADAEDGSMAQDAIDDLGTAGEQFADKLRAAAATCVAALNDDAENMSRGKSLRRRGHGKKPNSLLKRLRHIEQLLFKQPEATPAETVVIEQFKRDGDGLIVAKKVRTRAKPC